MSNINQQKLINNNKMRERYISVGGGPFERIYTKLWGGEVCVYQNQSHMANCYIASAGIFFLVSLIDRPNNSNSANEQKLKSN